MMSRLFKLLVAELSLDEALSLGGTVGAQPRERQLTPSSAVADAKTTVADAPTPR